MKNYCEAIAEVIKNRISRGASIKSLLMWLESIKAKHQANFGTIEFIEQFQAALKRED